MPEDQRLHKRIKRNLTLLYCPVDAFPLKWDMSIVDNISLGGIKFTAARGDIKLEGILYVRIKVPSLGEFIEVKAKVLCVGPRNNGRIYDIRAQFIDLTEDQKSALTSIQESLH